MLLARIIGGARRIRAEVLRERPDPTAPGLVVRQATEEIAWVDYNEDALAGADPPVLENFRLLVDLSDVTHYRHRGKGGIELWSVITILARTSAAATWELFFGVVLDVTAANVTVGYLEGGTVNADGTDPVTRVTEVRDYSAAPLDLRVHGADFLRGVMLTKTVETAITQTSAIKTSRPGNPTASPMPGDLIMRVRRTLGAGTARGRFAIRYRGIE